MTHKLYDNLLEVVRRSSAFQHFQHKGLLELLEAAGKKACSSAIVVDTITYVLLECWKWKIGA